MSNKNIARLLKELTDAQLSDESRLDVELFDGENAVISVKVQDRDEFPIYLTVDESQILCICYLFGEDEVDTTKRAEMNETMLMLNVSIPLSSFSKIANQYILFGALSPNSSVEEIINEIEILSDNVLEAIDAIAEYLKEAA